MDRRRAILLHEKQTGIRDVRARRAFNRALRGEAATALVGGADHDKDSRGNVWRIDGSGGGEACAIAVNGGEEIRIEQAAVPILTHDVSFGASTNVIRGFFSSSGSIVKIATAATGGGEIVVAPRAAAAVTLARLVDDAVLYIARPNILATSSALTLRPRADWSLWSKFTNAHQIFTEASGEGIAAFSANGSIMERELFKNESVQVEPSALVAYDAVVSVRTVARKRTWGALGAQRALGLYDGLNRYIFECRGPGRIFLQTREEVDEKTESPSS